MKKLFFLLVFLPSFNVVFSQISDFSPNFKALASEHRVLAILPFDIRIELAGLEAENTSDEQLKELEVTQSIAIQESLTEFLILRKIQKRFKVSFQPNHETNLIFKQNNITPETIAQYSRKQLAEVLGVDGIIYGSMAITKLSATPRLTYFDFVSGYFPPNGFSDMNIKVADANSGEVIWSYVTNQSARIRYSSDKLVSNMLRRAARKFPYKRL